MPRDKSIVFSGQNGDSKKQNNRMAHNVERIFQECIAHPGTVYYLTALKVNYTRPPMRKFQ